jgi:nucleoside-diphosphate-sugar epimerase
VVYPGDLDVLHSWTATADTAAALVVIARDGRGWGRAWHVPSTDLSLRALVTRFAGAAGAPPPRLERMTDAQLAAAAAVAPVMGEITEMRYLTDQPFVLDARDRGAVRRHGEPDRRGGG